MCAGAGWARTTASGGACTKCPGCQESALQSRMNAWHVPNRAVRLLPLQRRELERYTAVEGPGTADALHTTAAPIGACKQGACHCIAEYLASAPSFLPQKRAVWRRYQRYTTRRCGSLRGDNCCSAIDRGQAKTHPDIYPAAPALDAPQAVDPSAGYCPMWQMHSGRRPLLTYTTTAE